MTNDGPFLSRKRASFENFYLSKFLARFGCLAFIAFAAIPASAQTPTTPEGTAVPVSTQPPIGSQPANAQNPYTTPLPDNSLTPDNNQNGNSSQNPNSNQTPNPNSPNSPQQNSNANGSQSQNSNDNGNSNSTLPQAGTTPAIGTANSQATDVPLLPQQPSNPALQQNIATSNTQSSQITAPNLYATGAYDLTQIATTSALSQAYAPAENSEALPTSPLNPLRLGPFDLKAGMSIAVVNDNNIFAGQGGNGIGRDSDTTIAYTPSVLLQYGNHEGQRAYASIVYSPMLTRYSQFSAENSDDQNVAVNVQYPFQRLTLNLIDTYTQVTGVNQDLNARTTQISNIASFGGTYDINDKLTASANIQDVNTKFQGPGQTDDVNSINTNVSYHMTDKITLGPSFNAGLENPLGSVHQTYEQALFGATYLPTQKISLVGQAGVEFRQYTGGGSTTNPLFSAGATYTPFDSTIITVNGSQTVSPSTADSNQTSVNSSAGITASQRIAQRFFLGFSFSYSHSEYQNENGTTVQPGTVVPVNGTSPNNNRNQPIVLGSTQDNLVYRPSLTYVPAEWFTAALYYQYRDNISNSPQGGYHDNQFGLSISAQF
jgi:hypothetical protein